MTYYNRAEIGLDPAKAGPGPLALDEVEGLALHWPAIKTRIRGVDNVKMALRGWQAYHMAEKGWSDIGYQEAVDQDGNVYQLRGLRTRSGANGDQDVNRRFGALLLVLAPTEHPSDAMVAAVRGRVRVFRAIFPDGSRIVGHSEIRPEPTACPGPIVASCIAADLFEPAGPRTRGAAVDHALRDLRNAKGRGERGVVLRRARKLLRSLRSWRKR